jgi:2-methylcitrate dehydratase PrpD
VLHVALSKQAYDMHGHLPNYKGKFDALISGHYAAAVVLHDRALTLAQFEPARYDDPVLRRFAQEQVVFRLDPALSGVQAVVAAEMAEGAMLTARCEHPRGSLENPLTQAQVEDKFRTYAAGRIPASSVDGVINAVDDLEGLASVQTLMGLLEPVRRGRGDRAA